MEKREVLCTAGENANGTVTMETSIEGHPKFKIELSNDPTIPLLHIYLKETKAITWYMYPCS